MTIKNDRMLRPAHPGAILARELGEMQMSPAELDAALVVPSGTTARLLDAGIDITPELALRLSHYFGSTARFWTDLQNAYDLHVAAQKHAAAIAAQITPRTTPDNTPNSAKISSASN